MRKAVSKHVSSSDDIPSVYIPHLVTSKLYTPMQGSQLSAANFSKFRRPVCQIPWLTAANFPHIVTNFLWPLNLTKYAVFVAGNCN